MQIYIYVYMYMCIYIYHWHNLSNNKQCTRFRLSFVSLDTAEKYNTGKARAVEVEECSCPAGYRGLSCEDCDVGYTRAFEGLYLGICEQCNCNGHSNQCNPETGACEVGQ